MANLSDELVDSEEHELIQWASAGYPPVVEHERPLSEPEYIIPLEPTWADWQRAARRYVETGSKEHYRLMLTLVRLDHPVPSMWAEENTVKTTEKTSKPLTLFGLWTTPKPLTLADIWYGARWYVLIFTIWAISIVVGIQLFT